MTLYILYISGTEQIKLLELHMNIFSLRSSHILFGFLKNYGSHYIFCTKLFFKEKRLYGVFSNI